MPSFVLVHGGAHGAWCWEKLIPHLEADSRAAHVLAIDLVGHGKRVDEKPQDRIRLADYVDDIVGPIERADLTDVVLVGHSLAGISLPGASVHLAPRLRRLVFLSASIPVDGQSNDELMTEPDSPVSIGMDYRRMFANDLTPADAEWLLGNLGPEPPGPMAEPVFPSRIPDAVPRTFIVALRDEAVIPTRQRTHAGTIGADVVEIDAGHSSFVSKPRELAEILLAL